MFSFGLGKTSLSPSLATVAAAAPAPTLAALVAKNLGTDLPVTPEELGTPVMSQKKRGPKPKNPVPDDDEMDELGLETTKKRKRATPKRSAARKVKEEDWEDEDMSDEEFDEDDDEPVSKRQKVAKKAGKRGGAKKAAAKVDDDDDDEDEVISKKTGTRGRPAKATAAAVAEPAPLAPVDPVPVPNPVAAPIAGVKTDHLHTSNDYAVPALAADNLKIVSWNVAGYQAILGKGFKEYVASEKPDIICLQEVKCVADKAWAPEGYTKYWYPADAPGLHGTGVLSKIPALSVSLGLAKAEHNTEGRAITLEFDNFYLVTSYVPNAGQKLANLEYRQRWDVDFQAHLKALEAKKPVILCGDLNVAHTEIDLKNPKGNKKTPGFTQAERDGFTKMLSLGFVDMFREVHGAQPDCYTFWTYKLNSREKDVGWRLDYYVVSPSIVPRISEIYRRKQVMGSDHCPLVIHLKK